MALLVLLEIIAKWWIQLHQFSDYLSGYAGTLEWTDHFSASLSHLTSRTLMPSFDVQHLTDFDKMRYYCANMQTFAAHYTTRGNWPKLFTALIRVIFQINIHFTHLLGKRCWNCTILLWQKPFWSVIWKWQGRHFRKILEVAHFSLRDVTMAKIIRTNKLPGSPPPLVVINWQLSKQGIRWPVSLKGIAGSSVDPSKSSIFWSYPLKIY